MIMRFMLVLSVVLAGCGVAAPASSSPPVGVLPAGAVPRLAAVTDKLSGSDVSKDSTTPDLANRLRGWGYLSGWERTFQGESRKLTLVVSRSLMFRDRNGATAFVDFMRDHLAAFYPFASVEPLFATGSSGWMFEPPECACHMANPFLVAVSVRGRRVLRLEINGPLATPQALRSLFAKIPSSARTAA